MRRNLDIIRLLLLKFERSDQVVGLDYFSEEQQLYHSVLLIEAGYVHGVIIPDQYGNPISARVSRLTWTGHEFLELTRDDTIWNQAKIVVAESAKGAATEIVTSACKQLLSIGIEAAVRGLTLPRG
jgi:Hypothetical protein (DUF2513)